MLQEIFNFIINQGFWLTQKLTSIIIVPLLDYVLSNVPDIGSYYLASANFIDQYILKGTAFARQVLFNVTGFPPALFNLLVGFFFFKFGTMFILHGVKALLNGWAWLRTGRSVVRTYGGK